MDGGSLWNALTQLAWSLPTMLVCLIGLLFVWMRPMPKSAKMAAIASLVLTLMTTAVSFAFNIYIQNMAISGDNYSSESFRYTQIAYSALLNIMHISALILMLVAVCIRDNGTGVSDSVKKTENPYTLS